MRERLLKLVLSEEIIGDLRESGRPATREVLIALAPAIAFGMLGGAALIAISIVCRQGAYVLYVYGAIAIGMLFLSRFTARLTLFMLATIIFYVRLALGPHAGSLSFLGHAWRLGLMLVIGSVLSSLPLRRAKLRAG